jgi:hypothetical protein
LDRAEDSFASVHITINGEVTVFSNDSNFARGFFAGVFLDCPPSFHTWDDVEVVEEWVDEAQMKAMFAGLLAGALGWDPAQMMWLYSSGHTDTRAIALLERCVR